MAFTSAGEAGIINVASLDRAAILNAVATARDGDIVRLPAGTAEWTTTVRIDKAIILQGAGIGSTIITDGVFSGHLLEWLLVANKTSRMTGIEFRPGANISTAGNRNTYNRILVSGTNIDSRSMRIDNCRIASLAGPAFLFSTANGVVDNCTIIGAAEGVPAFVGHVKGSSWGGQQSVNTFGDGAYVDSDKFGTDQFTVFEDNTISNLFSSLTALDCQAGGRYVFRRNTMTKGSLETHGAEASRERSGRAFEIYDNTFIGDGVRSSPIYMRGGVGLVYNNTFTNWTASASISLLDNRSSDHLFSPISGADGRNPWDKNTPAKATGTVTSAGTLSVSDSSKTWTANQWAGHTIRRTSGKTVTSLTRSGTTCTAVAAAHGFATDTYISIWGADHYAYNGFYRITRVDDNTSTLR